MKSKLIAYLLWIFGGLGTLGLHRFYLHKIGTGFIWLLTGGVLWVGTLINLIALDDQVDAYNANYRPASK